jgi:alkaline phosphatase
MIATFKKGGSMSSKKACLAVTVFGLLLGAAPAAHAAPTQVAITPPNNARFLAGQRFDLRVEGAGAGPFSASMSIDGAPVAFSSGAQNTTTTDGITSAGFGGFNLRGYSSTRPGFHMIRATFTDASGVTVEVSSRFEIVSVRGGREPVKNIIIMLGDGMGTAHRTAARIVRYGVTQGDPDGYLAMDSFPATGMVTTHSLNGIVTDSSPGMACYSTGSHAQNGQEGVYPAHMTNPFFFPRVEYMSEFLHRTQGKSLGLLSTADVEDATPAANAIHTGNRGAGTGIIDQFLDESRTTGLSVLMGGGRRWFLPAGQFASSRATASDYPALPADLVQAWNLSPEMSGAVDPGRDVLAGFADAGFTYVDTATSLSAATSGHQVPDKLLGLFAYGNMNVALDKLAKRRNQLLPGTTTFAVDDYRAPDQPMLDEMTAAALKVLGRDRDGFVLMVEGAHIDKQSHAMDAERVIDEMLEFDRAVGVARDFAENVDRRTLVIVLADHETAGFSVIGGLLGGIQRLRTLPPDGGVVSPSLQPARQTVIGVYEGSGFPRYNILPDGYPETLDVDGKLLIGYGGGADRFETWLTQPKPLIDGLLPSEIRNDLAARGYVFQPVNRNNTQGFFIRGQALGRDQAVHTAADIPLSAFSPRRKVADQFVGVQRNTDVFFKLMRAANGGY